MIKVGHLQPLDDTEGNMIRGGIVAPDDTEGNFIKVGHLQPADDTEGNLIKVGHLQPADDTEGNAFRGGLVDDDDTVGQTIKHPLVGESDTEGHAGRYGGLVEDDAEGHAARFGGLVQEQDAEGNSARWGGLVEESDTDGNAFRGGIVCRDVTVGSGHFVSPTGQAFELSDEDLDVSDAEGHVYAIERLQVSNPGRDGSWAVERLVISDNVGNLFSALPAEADDTEGHRVRLSPIPADGDAADRPTSADHDIPRR